MKRQFTCVLLALAVVTACCAKQHPREAHEALASLRKIQAATQIGVSYSQYGQLLIEAKDKTNAAARVLPDVPLKAELQLTMDVYADAGQVWAAKVKRDGWNTSQEPGFTVVSKYPLKTSEAMGIEFIKEDDAIQTIWRNADLHLSKLDELGRTYSWSVVRFASRT